MGTFTSTILATVVLVAASYAAPNEKFSLKLPDECKGKGFCNIKPTGYDEKMQELDDLLTPTFIAQNFGDRIGEPEKAEELSPKKDWHNCPYRKTIEESAYAYSNSNDSTAVFIIQHRLFRQRIETITCANDKISLIDTDSSEECFQHLDLKSFNMKSSCQSSTAKRSLLVLDNKTGKPMKKSYDVPCCCTCHIVRTN